MLKVAYMQITQVLTTAQDGCNTSRHEISMLSTHGTYRERSEGVLHEQARSNHVFPPD